MKFCENSGKTIQYFVLVSLGLIQIKGALNFFIVGRKLTVKGPLILSGIPYISFILSFQATVACKRGYPVKHFAMDDQSQMTRTNQ